MGILAWIIFGLIAGALAKFNMPVPSKTQVGWCFPTQSRARGTPWRILKSHL